MRIQTWGRIAAVFGCLLSASCSEGSSPAAPPQPGRLILSLETPNVDDGAVLISLAGGAMSGFSSEASSHLVYFRSTGTNSVNVAVVVNITSGPILRFDVPDVARASLYQAVLVEVAGSDNELRTSVVPYAVQVSAEN